MVKIENFIYGCITIDKKDYKDDVYILANGFVISRKHDLHKAHTEVSKEEIEFLLKDEPEVIIIGTGKQGRLKLSKEAKAFCNAQKIKIELFETQKAINRFNWYAEKNKKVAGLFHVTD